MVHLGNDWDEILKDEWDKPYYLLLRRFLKQEYQSRTVYPDMNDIFNALRYTAFRDVKAVILGQDPYHGAGQAHGLCFSVKKGVDIPPSLQNIYKEMQSDLGITPPSHGELTHLAKQGVLMLNTVLTVRSGQAASHRGHGWETFTDRVISEINEKTESVVFILWGRPAAEKAEIITNPIHLKLKAPHPSPLSAHRGFFGSRPFSKTNDFLTAHGIAPIDWQIPENQADLTV